MRSHGKGSSAVSSKTRTRRKWISSGPSPWPTGKRLRCGHSKGLLDGSPDRRSARPGFDELRKTVEQRGVCVLLQGDLGSHHTAIDTAAFRGFALADRLAPFIVINSNDARTAWSFTLLHETVHLLLGESGISGGDAESRVERFCNDVASECLLPAAVVDTFRVTGLGRGELIEAIGRLSGRWKVSRALVAYRLQRAGKIDAPLYAELAEAFRRQWMEERQRRGTGEGGPDYYRVRRHRVGDALLQRVARGLAEGTLPTTKAALVLGVKPTQVGRILGAGAAG